MAEENIDIFSDFQEQDFANSQEYFDYLKNKSKEYQDYATDPEKVTKDRETFFNQTTDLLKIAPNAGVETANILMNLLEIPADLYASMSGDERDAGGFWANIAEDRIPRIPRLKYSNPNMEYVDKTAAALVGSPLAFLKGLDLLANKAPRAYKAMREMYPYSVGQMHDSFKIKGFWKGLADIMPKQETSEALARNLVLIGAAGLGGMYSSGDPANKPQPVDMPVEEVDDAITIDPRNFLDAPNVKDMADAIGKAGAPGLALGGEPGQFTDSMITGVEEDIDIQDFNLGPAYEGIDDLESLFEEANLKPTQKSDLPPEVQVANLFGKVPMWAIGKVPKWKMLLQDFTKNEKSLLEAIKKKLKSYSDKDEILEDISISDMPAGQQAVKTVDGKKTILDSPEPNESVFYSEIEARLMDPNTPKEFTSTDDLFSFLKRQGISKAEIDDNILTRYINAASKSGAPLKTEDMLSIVRQAPLRNIKSTVYGNEAFNGTKAAQYDGQYLESGYIPNTYREEVLYLPSDKIPFDPDKLPGTTHSFDERYVIGWSRLTDREGRLKVKEGGLKDAVDIKQMKTIEKNQKKLQNQLIGLEASAVRRLERDGLIELDDVDNLTREEMRNVLNEGDNMARLNSIDPALEQQILQYRMKLESDGFKLQKMKSMVEGDKVTVTFADEIQSDILQQAKQMEEKFKEQLGDLMDKNIDFVKEKIRTSQAGYSGDFRNINPEVAEYFLKNKSVFRPIFQNETEMQQFMNEYAKTQLVLEELAAAGMRPSKELMNAAKEARTLQTKLLRDLDTAMSKESLELLFPNVPFKNRNEWGSALLKMNLANAAKRLFVDKVDNAATEFAVSPAKFIKERYWKGQDYGGTDTPFAQRKKTMKGIGTEEFYGGVDSNAPKKWAVVDKDKPIKEAVKDKDGNTQMKITGYEKVKDHTPTENKEDAINFVDVSKDTVGANYGVVAEQKHFTSVLEKALRTAAKENNSEVRVINVDGVGDVWSIKLTPEMLLPHKTHRKKGGMVYTPELIDIFEVA